MCVLKHIKHHLIVFHYTNSNMILPNARLLRTPQLIRFDLNICTSSIIRHISNAGSYRLPSSNHHHSLSLPSPFHLYMQILFLVSSLAWLGRWLDGCVADGLLDIRRSNSLSLSLSIYRRSILTTQQVRPLQNIYIEENDPIYKVHSSGKRIFIEILTYKKKTFSVFSV